MSRNLSPVESMMVVVGVCAALGAAFVLLRPREELHEPTTCLSQTKQMALGLEMYAGDFDDRWPPAKAWMDLDDPYTKNPSIFHCPELPKTEYGYAMSSHMSNGKQADDKDPQKTVLLFESSITERNAHTSLAGMTNPGRHHGASMVAYADGHAKAIHDGLKP
jgi:prepilin-type processing-associated H-X9-DG protein